MCKAVTVHQIQRLDKIAIERCGIPSLVLMENAGRAVAEEVKKFLRGKKNPRVCVVCGTGNNGGDGFVAARHLVNAGIAAKIFLVGQARRLKHDAAVNYQILKRSKYAVREVGNGSSLPVREIARADVVVDAVFGAGLN